MVSPRSPTADQAHRAMETDSGEHAAKRRRVRKGTHSCWECRRRKVKCRFSSPEDDVCITCRRRNAQCISQVVSDKLELVVDDDGGIEKETDTNVHVPGEDVRSLRARRKERCNVACSVPSSAPSSVPSSLAPNPLDRGHNAKTLSSRGGREHEFESPSEHGRTSQWSSTIVNDNSPNAEETNDSKIVQILLQTLPCRSDMEILLEKTSKISTYAYQSNFRYSSAGSDRKTMPPEQIPLPSLLYPESHPVLLGRQLLLFSASLQNLPPNQDFPGLTENYREIMKRLAETTIRVVTSNDTLLRSLEALENIILEGLYHIDSGNIRRAWITMRRAVTAGQLLGLHRPGQQRYKRIIEEADLDPEVLWACSVAMERMLSVLLGLPTSTSNMGQHPASQTCDLPGPFSAATARIIERNDTNDRERHLALTQEIDKELMVASEQLPSSLWRPLAFAGLDVDSAEAFWETRRGWESMCYYTLVNQLHLPYMLCQSCAPHAMYSRMACVTASREILSREVTLRTFNPVTACYRMGDFMTLIAGMTLILAHVVSHCIKDGANLLAHQRLRDRAAVEQALECMRNMSEVCENLLAAKCVTLLKSLLAIETQAAQGRVCHIQRQHWTEGVGGDDDPCLMVIQVPYVGYVKFVLDRQDSSMAPSVPHGCGSDIQDLTIGGLGSVQFKNAKSSADGGCLGAATDRRDEHANQDPLVLQSQMFPDAAADVDDWALQGFDTAFFDALLGGVEGETPWNFSGALM